MDDPVINLLSKLKGKKYIAYVIVLGLIIIGIANFTDALRTIYKFLADVVAHYQEIQLTDEELKKEGLKTAKELMDMVIERQANEPNIDFNNWQESTQNQIKYSQETQNLYYRNFASHIAFLRGEFIKRGKQDKDLDLFYEHPTNYLGMRTLASKLALLAESL